MPTFEMRFYPLRPEDVAGLPGEDGIFDQIMDGMRRQLEGDGWEPLSHAITEINGELKLSVMWRRPD